MLNESNYKRIQRFFKGFEVDSVARTEWQFGTSVFNILVLRVVHRGVAIPLVWSMLDKRANSNTLERMNLFARFLEHFGNVQISHLCGDREFIGQLWLSYLRRLPRRRFAAEQVT